MFAAGSWRTSDETDRRTKRSSRKSLIYNLSETKHFHLVFEMRLPTPSLFLICWSLRSQPSGTWSVIGVSAAVAYSTAPNDALGRLPGENSISSSHSSLVISRNFPLYRTGHNLLALPLNWQKTRKIQALFVRGVFLFILLLF